MISHDCSVPHIHQRRLCVFSFLGSGNRVRIRIGIRVVLSDAFGPFFADERSDFLGSVVRRREIARFKGSRISVWWHSWHILVSVRFQDVRSMPCRPLSKTRTHSVLFMLAYLSLFPEHCYSCNGWIPHDEVIFRLSGRAHRHLPCIPGRGNNGGLE